MSPKVVHVGKTKKIVCGHNVITILSVSTLHLSVGVFHSPVALFSLVRSFTACLSFQCLLFVFQAFWFQIRPPHLFVKKLQSHFCILHFTNLTPTHFSRSCVPWFLMNERRFLTVELQTASLCWTLWYEVAGVSSWWLYTLVVVQWQGQFATVGSDFHTDHRKYCWTA